MPSPLHDKRIFQGYAVAPFSDTPLHFGTGTLSQLSGQVRALDKTILRMRKDPALLDYLPKHDQLLIGWAGEDLNEEGWNVEIHAVPYPLKGVDHDALMLGLPGQLCLEDDYIWEPYNPGDRDDT